MNVDVLIFPSNSSCINYVRYPVNAFSISFDRLLIFMEIIHDNGIWVIVEYKKGSLHI